MDLITTEGAPAPRVSIMDIVERAYAMPDLDLERISRLLELKERTETREAMRAYASAFVEFKRKPPEILKNKQVKYGNTQYKHATHDEACFKVAEALARHGLAHYWGVTQHEDGRLTITCSLLHVLGHRESVSMTGAPDTTGSKSMNQAIASTQTFWQRYTLLTITGLSTTDMPDEDDRQHPQARPVIAEEVWSDLKSAADIGADALREAWQKAGKQTRKDITEHYPDAWEQLKNTALREPS